LLLQGAVDAGDVDGVDGAGGVGENKNTNKRVTVA
jgi:hypothetical protein